jgi:hypothetical protein
MQLLSIEKEKVYNQSMEKKKNGVQYLRYINKTTFKPVKLDKHFKQSENSIFWIQSIPSHMNSYKPLIFYGHTIHSLEFPKIEKFENSESTVIAVGLNTGCCFGGYLSAAVFHLPVD